MKDDPPPPKPRTREQVARDERLKAALRDNLKRRRSRARIAGVTDASPDASDGPAGKDADG